MKYYLNTYTLLPSVDIPKIPMEVLWDLGILFGLASGMYALLIFVFRYRIRVQRRQQQIRKKELAPMISQYLFYPQDSGPKGQEAALNSRMQIRKLLAKRLDRKVLAGILMDLVQDVSGEARTRLLSLYQDLGLQEDAYRDLRSRRWEKAAGGIRELSEMQVAQAYFVIRRFVNHRRSILRKQAEFAIIGLTEEGIGYFLDNARHPISEWQQLQIMEILRRRGNFEPPDFGKWLASENQDVQLFALRLIRHYRQHGAGDAVMALIGHTRKDIRVAAIECLRDFAYAPAREALKQAYPAADPECRVLILDAFQRFSDINDRDWVQAQASKDASFLVRGKAKSVLASLQPVVGQGPMAPGTIPAGLEAAPAGAGAPPEAQPTGHGRDLSASFRDVMDLLKPDFGALEVPPADFEAGEEQHALLETGVDLPEEFWNEEYEQIFNECVVESLIETLSMATLPEGSWDGVPEFLPYVTEQSPKTTAMSPHDPCPDWLRRLEVQSEIVFSDSGYARILREVLLEGLKETGQVLNTDFVPLVTPAQSGEEDPREASSGDMEEPGAVLPEFEVLPDEIIQQPDPVSGPPGMEDPASADRHMDPDFSYFSIFKEFFRSYDTESKLILMEEIPEIGGEKELQFLKTLLQDPDVRIRKKARITHNLLAKKIGPKGADSPGNLHNATPDPALPGATAREGDPGDGMPASEGEYPEYLELNFIPEFELNPSGESRDMASGNQGAPDGYLSFLRNLNDSQRNDEQ